MADPRRAFQALVAILPLPSQPKVQELLKAIQFRSDLYLLPAYANNAAAIAGGLAAGMLYRTGGDPDLVAVVH